MICRLAKFYGGGAPLHKLTDMPFDELSMIWDEMRWHEGEIEKSMKGRNRGF